MAMLVHHGIAQKAVGTEAALPALAGIEYHVAYIRQVVEGKHTTRAIQITPADAHIPARRGG
jgi:hypothetical protein